MLTLAKDKHVVASVRPKLDKLDNWSSFLSLFGKFKVAAE